MDSFFLLPTHIMIKKKIQGFEKQNQPILNFNDNGYDNNTELIIRHHKLHSGDLLKFLKESLPVAIYKSNSNTSFEMSYQQNHISKATDFVNWLNLMN